MPDADTQIKVTKNCRGCHQPMHLVQDNSGSLWMHDRAVDEHNCWTDHRDDYEGGTL